MKLLVYNWRPMVNVEQFGLFKFCYVS